MFLVVDEIKAVQYPKAIFMEREAAFKFKGDTDKVFQTKVNLLNQPLDVISSENTVELQQ